MNFAGATPYDGHTLHGVLEQAEILSAVKPLMAFVDRGYRGVELAGVQVRKSGQRRGVTRGLKAMIKQGLFVAQRHQRHAQRALCSRARARC